MNKTDKILILGGTGLVGTHLTINLKKKGFLNVTSVGSKSLNLLKQWDVEQFFSKNSPDYIFFAAAKVGGIKANTSSPATFILDNLTMQNNVFRAVVKHRPKKIFFFGSNCIYPKSIVRAFQESDLLNGPIEETNEAYAIAKIAGIKSIEAIRKQYGLKCSTIIPASLYGPNDNFDSENSHVIAGLISRMTKAILNNEDKFLVWGSGEALREFLFADDLADICVNLMESEEDQPSIINIGSSEEVSIKDLVKMIQELLGFEGEVIFDSKKPEGVKRKLLSCEFSKDYHSKPLTKLNDGLKETIRWYQNHNAV